MESTVHPFPTAEAPKAKKVEHATEITRVAGIELSKIEREFVKIYNGWRGRNDILPLTEEEILAYVERERARDDEPLLPLSEEEQERLAIVRKRAEQGGRWYPNWLVNIIVKNWRGGVSTQEEVQLDMERIARMRVLGGPTPQQKPKAA